MCKLVQNPIGRSLSPLLLLWLYYLLRLLFFYVRHFHDARQSPVKIKSIFFYFRKFINEYMSELGMPGFCLVKVFIVSYIGFSAAWPLGLLECLTVSSVSCPFLEAS
jgi:hypothetical protein